MNKQLIAVLLLVLIALLMSCKGPDRRHANNRINNNNDLVYENPIDSIIHNTTEENRFEEVQSFLICHPDFVNNSDAVGYHRYLFDDPEKSVIWEDCEDIRVYSIPCPTLFATLNRNIIQFINDGTIDTQFLQDNEGGLERLVSIKSKEGKTFYILKTSLHVEHQGLVAWEHINAFSEINGRLSKEDLFHTKTKSYDYIEVGCGGQRYLPLDFYDLVLICMCNFEDRYETPSVVFAEINNNDWPTGNGLKYSWNGSSFEYIGKCKYDANDILYE